MHVLGWWGRTAVETDQLDPPEFVEQNRFWVEDQGEVGVEI